MNYPCGYTGRNGVKIGKPRDVKMGGFFALVEGQLCRGVLVS